MVTKFQTFISLPRDFLYIQSFFAEIYKKLCIFCQPEYFSGHKISYKRDLTMILGQYKYIMHKRFTTISPQTQSVAIHYSSKLFTPEFA